MPKLPNRYRQLTPFAQFRRFTTVTTRCHTTSVTRIRALQALLSIVDLPPEGGPIMSASRPHPDAPLPRRRLPI